MSKRKVIVFGINHTNTLGLIRSLGEAGYPVIVLLEACNLKFCFLRFSKYITKVHYLKSTEDALKLLWEEYCDVNLPPVIVSASDSAANFLDVHYDELKGKCHFFNAGEQGRIGQILNKNKMQQLAEACGLTVIRSRPIASKDDLKDETSYPCLLKSSNSYRWGKAGLAVYYNRQELESAIEDGVEYLLQDYIEKDYELDVVGLSLDHGGHIILPATVRKIRDFLDRQSVFVRLDDIADYPSLPIEAIKEYVRKIGYEGIFSVEFIYSKGTYHFLEINLRNDGCGYVYTAAGINYPAMWAGYCEGNLLEVPAKVLTKLPIYMMQEPDLWGVFDGRVKLRHWLGDFLRTRVFFTLSLRDPLPFLYTVYVHFRQAGKKLLRLI